MESIARPDGERLAVELPHRREPVQHGPHLLGVDGVQRTPVWPDSMSTRQTACPAPPWVGEASVVMVATGVLVWRVSAERMTGIADSPKLDNMIVEKVNQVVGCVN